MNIPYQWILKYCSNLVNEAKREQDEAKLSHVPAILDMVEKFKDEKYERMTHQ